MTRGVGIVASIVTGWVCLPNTVCGFLVQELGGLLTHGRCTTCVMCRVDSFDCFRTGAFLTVRKARLLSVIRPVL